MEKHEAFLTQARSDFRVFELLWAQTGNGYPECHALQHLQMATEKLAKSILIIRRPSDDLMSHVAFRQVRQFINLPDTARRLGYLENAKVFRDLLDRRKEWFQEIERLSPSVGTELSGNNNGPNVEYPWQARVKIWCQPGTFPPIICSRWPNISEPAMGSSLLI